MARHAGFDNISLDLMMWLPQQTVASWLESVDALIALGPDHASLYLLEMYPNAPLERTWRERSGRWRPTTTRRRCICRDCKAGRRGLRAVRDFERRRPGRPSRHNLKYWTDGEWLGFGCGAHSTRAGVRWKNLSATAEYIETVGGGGELGSRAAGPVATGRSSRRQCLQGCD